MTPEEDEALEKLRMYIRHGSPENYRHLTAAGRAMIHADFNRSKGRVPLTKSIFQFLGLVVLIFGAYALSDVLVGL